MRDETEQFDFRDMLDEMEAAEQSALDAHRTKVQAFFDGLTVEQKNVLGAFMHGPEWQTCQALSAAACDWHQSSRPRKSNAEIAAGTHAAVASNNA